jgi:hypothetical protein
MPQRYGIGFLCDPSRPTFTSSCIGGRKPFEIILPRPGPKMREDSKRGSFPQQDKLSNLRNLMKQKGNWKVKFETFCLGMCDELHRPNLRWSLCTRKCQKHSFSWIAPSPRGSCVQTNFLHNISSQEETVNFLQNINSSVSSAISSIYRASCMKSYVVGSNSAGRIARDELDIHADGSEQI